MTRSSIFALSSEASEVLMDLVKFFSDHVIHFCCVILGPQKARRDNDCHMACFSFFFETKSSFFVFSSGLRPQKRERLPHGIVSNFLATRSSTFAV